MDSSVSSWYRDILFQEPDTLTDEDLLKIPLSTLSKSLDPRLSPHSAVFVYLRWLEIHRREETKVTQHWANTCLHWCQALRSRGLTENKLVHEVEKWKANKIFHSISRRYPPTPFDIAKAYDDGVKKWLSKDEMSSKVKDSDFAGLPPPGYICNRCGRKGHHLQVCPTNLDPKYDKPPGDDYQCPVCGKYGDHYKSICALNTDPNCIGQKRKREEIERGRELRFGRDEEREYDGYYTSPFRRRNTSSSSDSRSRSPPRFTRRDMVSRVTHNYRSVWTPDDIKNFDEIDISDDEPSKPAQPDDKKYFGFVLGLIERQGTQMTAKVNEFKGRKSALDMWETVQFEATQHKALSLLEAPVSHYSPVKGNSGRLTPYEEDPMDDISWDENDDVVYIGT